MPQNPLVGGTVLRRAAIQSPNFVQSPLAGWAINADGSAYFANLTLSGTFSGTDYVINADGSFFYSGTPSAGNLIVSIASTAGTDAFGNAYPQGINVTQGTISGTTISGTDYVINSTGAFFYSSAPALGNLIGSIANTAGTDSYGNAYLAGMATYDGTGRTTQLASGGLSLASTLDTFTLQAQASTDELDLTSANGTLLVKFATALMTVTGGALKADELLTYAGVSGTITQSFGSTTTLTFPASTTGTARIQAWGAAGGGASAAGSGGGGGEYAEAAASAVTPGGTLTITIGAAGSGGAAGGSHDGTAGGNTTTTGAGTTAVTAHGGGAGKAAGTPGGTAGTGSANSIHHDGGAGGTSTGGSEGGGGGGGAGGPTGAGGAGGNASGHTPGGGGAAGAGGGAGAGSGGGWGGSSPTVGGTGGTPGGAGGAGGWDGASNFQAGGAGTKGRVMVTYSVSATNLIAGVAGVGGTDPINSASYPAGCFGLQQGTDYVTLASNGSNAVAQWGAAGGSADVALLRPNSGRLQLATGSGFTYTANVSSSQGSVTTHTVTQSGDTALTDSWSIPASDLKAGTVYALRAKGYGEWATSGPQNLVLGTGIDGSGVRSETISSALFGTSQHFEWDLEYTLLCISTGVSGKVWLAARMTLSAVGFTHTLTTGQVTMLFGSNDSPGSSGGETLDTTAAHTMQLMAHWATTTGTPTITTRHQTFDRVGT